MLDESVRKRIDDIIGAEIGIDPATIDINRPIRDQVSLDSMQFIGLIARLETELNAELPISIMQVITLREFYGEIQTVVSCR